MSDSPMLLQSLNTNQLYDVSDIEKLEYVCNVGYDFEENFLGVFAKFYAPEGHTVYFYNEDIEKFEKERNL